MKKIASLSIQTMVALIGAVLLWLILSESGLRWIYTQAQKQLPSGLSIEQIDGSLLGTMELSGVKYQQEQLSVELKQAAIKWNLFGLLLGRVHIKQMRLDTLLIDLPPPINDNRETAAGSFAFPIGIKLEDTQLRDLMVKRQGEELLVLKQIDIDASADATELGVNNLALKTKDVSLELNGDVNVADHYRHDIKVQWSYTMPHGVEVKGHGDLKGNGAYTLLQQTVTNPSVMTLKAELQDVFTALYWRLQLASKNVDLNMLMPDLPAYKGSLDLSSEGDLVEAQASMKLNGQLDQQIPLKLDTDVLWLQQDGLLQIKKLEVSAPDTETLLIASGDVHLVPDVRAAMTLHWRNLHWPLQQNKWFDSAIGSAWIVSDFTHYQFGIATDRPRSEAPPSMWYASASGDSRGIDFDWLRIHSLDGELEAVGDIAWSPYFRWQADLSAMNINPGKLWEQWPGSLQADIQSRGQWRDNALASQVTVRRLHGKLRGYPVELQSQVEWNKQGLKVDSLEFGSGESTITASGSVTDQWQLQWSLQSQQLAELVPQAKGALVAQGRLSGKRENPVISASLKGQLLAYQDYRLESLEGQAEVDSENWRDINIDISAKNIDIDGNLWQSLRLTSSDNVTALTADSESANVSLELRGKPMPNGWQGQLVKANLVSSEYANWRLQTPANIHVDSSAIRFDEMCWLSGRASLCAAARRDDAEWKTRLVTSHLPLSLANSWLPADINLAGAVDANINLQFLPPASLMGQLDMQLAPGRLSYPLPEGERDQWRYQSGHVEVLAGDQGIQVTALITMPNQDRVDAEIQLPKARMLQLDADSQSLKGQIKFNISDLGIVEAITPEVQDLVGNIDVNVKAGGTLSKPDIQGRAQMVDASLRIPRLGLHINKLNLAANSVGLKKFDYRLSAQSGKGDMRITGSSEQNDKESWKTRVTATGNNFEVSQIPEARVVVSPNMVITQEGQTIHVDGELLIPAAKLQPKDTTSAAKVSPDVVFVGGEKERETEKWNMFTRLNLKLGDRVEFYGFGFEGRFSGGLLLEDVPHQLTKATGEVAVVEGRYRAYGQHLDVEEGRILYTGGLLTNPGLDLRAVRNVDELKVGLKVRGSLNQPQVELFSEPAMGQTEALSYLVLGQPIDEASSEEGALMASAVLALGLSGGDRLARVIGDRFGLDEMRIETASTGDQASLAIGRYLTPRLYVGYGIGLIESANTLRVRYKLSDKWILKGESGEYQGVDVLYTLER